MNDRFRRNQDGDTETRTGHDVDDAAFRSFAVWVNNPVSDTSYHHIPDGLQEAVDDVADPKERQRLRAVLRSYERRELSPREFVRLIMESDDVDFFDPLSTPEGWGSYGEDGFDGPPEAESGRLLLKEPDDAFDDEDVEDFRERVTAGGVTDKGRAPSTDRPSFPWVEVFVGLLIVALLVAVYAVTSGVV